VHPQVDRENHNVDLAAMTMVRASNMAARDQDCYDADMEAVLLVERARWHVAMVEG
jgi:hypothetical protein